MSTIDAYPRLVSGLNEVRRQWRFQKVIEGALLAVSLVLVVVVAVVAADNLLRLEKPGRGLLAMVLWGSAAYAFLRWVLRRAWEDRRDDFFAALVEQRHPELSNRLINALQLGRGHHVHGSPRLIEQIVDDAAVATADLELADCLSWRAALRGGRLALAALLVLGIYATAPAFGLSERFLNGLSRVLLPWTDTPAFTATKVAIAIPRDSTTKIPIGNSITIEARATGDVPRAAWLHVQDRAGHWRRLAMKSGHAPTLDPVKQPSAGNTPAPAAATKVPSSVEAATGVFHLVISEPAESFRYYVSAGDGRSSGERQVEVVPRPDVESLQITYVPPSYTGLPPATITDSDGELAALPGTRITLAVRTTKALQSRAGQAAAELITEAKQALPLATAGSSRDWQLSFTLGMAGIKLEGAHGHLVTAPTRYRLRLIDTDGYDNGQPVWRSILLTKDQPPSVAVVAPGKDLQVRPQEQLTLRLAAKDDYGLADLRLFVRLNDENRAREVHDFSVPSSGPKELTPEWSWDLSTMKLKTGDTLSYWAVARDGNVVTGPGQGESRRFTLFVVEPEKVLSQLESAIPAYAEILEELLRLQRENRAQTTAGVAAKTLVARQSTIRQKTRQLAERMRADATPLDTVVTALEELHAGLMAEAVQALETARDGVDSTLVAQARQRSLPLQDEIIERLAALLARLQKNEQARNALRKLAKKDPQAHWSVSKQLHEMVDDLERLLAEEEELTDKFEKLPKKPVDELSEEELKTLEELDEFRERWEKWAKGTIDELTKLPTGFVDDFGLREDVNRIFQEIEKAATRPKSEKLEVALEDLGAALATEMLEDLEVWMPDSPDATQWVLEEPPGGLKVPEMPLPSELEDMVGDLLQEADEFDQEADDITSAWGDNLNQAGWDVADGPISNFSAKGKTGNDLPNNMEVSGRAGDGRRGKSSGQMVGDSARGLDGRKTPARVNNERYEPGQVKQETSQDPNGATGGGKKSGAGRRGLQGGTPPDFVKDMERLSEKQAAVRERAEQVARELETHGVKSTRLNRSVEMMRTVEDDLRDKRYDDAARRRKTALSALKSAFSEDGRLGAVELNRARDLPAELREELLQAAEEGYPPGYETLLQQYFRALSEEK